MLVNRHKIVRTEELGYFINHAGHFVYRFVQVYDHGLRREYEKTGDGPPVFQGDTWEGETKDG